MQIFRAKISRKLLHLFLASICLCLASISSSQNSYAIDLQEKQPAIAPPTASFRSIEGRQNSLRVPPNKLRAPRIDNVFVEPIAPPSAKAEETPTTLYNKGALAYHQKDFATALKYWVRASDLGVMGATWRAAHMYRLGHGTAVDHVKAFGYFQQVAEKHKYNTQRNRFTPLTIDALVWVGSYYRKGLPDKNIKPDPKKALKIFRHAASHGQHPVAQFHLGDMYVTGNGVKANGPRGMRWHNLAAKKNFAPSLAALGELFWQGKAVKANKSRAMMFFFLAIQSGRSSEKGKFRERLAQLRATATEPEIEEAQLLLNKWVASKQIKKAN